jgi:[ribosomal protein S18]-alanine N-acetyltransferase
LRIRRLESRDVDAILAIQSACPEIAQWSSRDYQRVANGEMAGWVSDDDRGASGFLVARRLVLETEILNFAVRPDRRRQGIGTKLIETVIQWSKGLGVEGVMLEVRASNAVAIRFYEGHGFTAAGRRPRYYTNPSDDALLLNMLLSRTADQSR